MSAHDGRVVFVSVETNVETSKKDNTFFGFNMAFATCIMSTVYPAEDKPFETLSPCKKKPIFLCFRWACMTCHRLMFEQGKKK